MTHDDLMHRLWWMRRSQAAAVAEALLTQPVPTTVDEVEARLPDLPYSTVAQVAESLLAARD